MTGAGQTDGLPVRLISRLTTEAALMNMRQSLRLVPGRLETSIVAQALIRCALPELFVSGRLVVPPATPLIGSIGSIARSFERSPETIRRHVHVLAKQGFFTVEQDGVRLTARPEAGARILSYLQGAHDNILWLIEELDSWGLVTHREGGPKKTAPLERILRTALDLRLLGFETFRGPLGGWTSLALWNALSAASVRHITSDRRLSKTFSQRSTPDTLRRPTSVRALSAATGMPYATVWRHFKALEKAGKVGRRGEGYAMLTEQLLTADIEARVARYVTDVLNRVNKLVADGIDPSVIPALYIDRRPVLVPLG